MMETSPIGALVARTLVNVPGNPEEPNHIEYSGLAIVIGRSEIG